MLDSDNNNQMKKNIEQDVKNILKNGTGSSKEDLQQWWNRYH